MKEVLFAIPDQKYQYFMEMMGKLGFLEYLQDHFEIPVEHQQEIVRLVAESKETDFEDWETIKGSIGFDA